MSSVLTSGSILREAVKKLVIVDISLRHPNAHLKDSEDKMYQIMEKMKEIDGMGLYKRIDVICELKKVEPDEKVIKLLMTNLFKVNNFTFMDFQVDDYMSAWSMLKRTWKEGFVPWNGETLFLKGENSDYIKSTDEAEIKEFFPNSKIETISKSGHWPHLDNQDEFIQKVIKFI